MLYLLNTGSDNFFVRKSSDIIEAKIDVIKNMGSELFLYVTAGETVVTARIKGGTELALGKQISLAINMMKVHFFDTETEEAIR